jgi:hypothetical protein
VIVALVRPVAAAVNVEVAAAVPAAAVNVTFTPVWKLFAFSETDVGVNEIAVLPARVSVTVTVCPAAGAVFRRMLDTPLWPP